MAINTALLVQADVLQNYLVDKTTGEPLAGGIITFYQDATNPTILKNVYYQTGTFGAYTYTAFPNPLTLSSVGTIVDPSGNNQIPFFYPYNENNEQEVQTYYITVYNSTGTLQFTIHNFPLTVQATGGQIQSLNNLLPNGQFLAHNNLTNNTIVNGTQQVSNVVFDDAVVNPNTSSVLAAGGTVGWYFAKSNGSTSTDLAQFIQVGQEPTSLVGNPKYILNLSCSNANSMDTFKEFRIRFTNVNRFQSNSDPAFQYTFAFAALNNNSGTQNIPIKIIKYFGSGGSSPIDTEVGSLNFLNTNYSIQSLSFTFGSNGAYTIATNQPPDDFIEISIVLPATSNYNISITDFMLFPGSIVVDAYPEVPDTDVYPNTLIGALPQPDPGGNDLYLPIVLTQNGFTYDISQIGKIYAGIYSTPGAGELLCNGDQLFGAGYSSVGIPYSRLQTVLTALGSRTVPLYGTGANYATGLAEFGTTNNLQISTNTPGSQTGATDVNTGFAFNNVHTGQTTTVVAYSNTTAEVIVYGLVAGPPSAAAVDVNTGFTIIQLVNNAFSYQVFVVACTAGSAITSGHYFTYTNTASATYNVWFNVNGAGGGPGGTAIEVNILSTYTAQDVADALRVAISGYQVSEVVCNAASTLTAGKYFTFAANSITYYVWYQIAGVGTAPGASSSTTAIKVALDGTETSAQVCTATATAINSLYYALPDFRGLFLRGLRGSGMWDVQAASRWSMISGYFGNNVGTFEEDTFQSHVHTGSLNANIPTIFGSGGELPSLTDTAASTSSLASPYATTFTTAATGTAETQPVNAAVNWFIKY